MPAPHVPNHMRQSRNRNQKLFVVALLVILVMFFSRNWIKETVGADFGAAALNISASAIEGASDAKILNSKKELRKRISYLEQTTEENQALKLEIDLLKTENATLKDVLGRDVTDSPSILARVTAVPSRTPYDTLILDAGENQGIKVGDKVLYFNSIALGEIVEVYGNSSRARLYTTPGVVTPAVLSSSSQFVELHGRGGGNFEVELPRDFEISDTETVILPGLHSYTIGTLLRSISDPRDPFKRVVLKSPVSISTLDWVEVISQ